MTKKNENKPAPKLPNLASYVISTVLILWVVILSGQWLKAGFEHEESITVKRIGLYEHQNVLALEIINSILNFQVSGTEIAKDNAKTRLRIAMNGLKIVIAKLQGIGDFKAINLTIPSDIKIDIAEQIDPIILTSNEILALMEADMVDNHSIDGVYKSLLEISYHLQKNSEFLVRKLITQLQDKRDEVNRISWLITAVTMLLVLLVNAIIFMRGKRLVKKQFKDLKKLTNQLEIESERATQNGLQVQKEAEASLGQQRKLSSILDSTVDAIITITADGTVDSFNKAAETMFGYLADSVIGQNIRMLMPEPYSSEHDSYLANYHKTGEKKVIGHIREVVGRRIDGSEFPLRLSVSEVIDSDPKLFTGIIRDITKRKENEAKLEQTLTELTQKQAEFDEEERIARHVFENITTRNNDIIPEISLWCQPMRTFSGDMMLSAVLPSGGIRVLLCDFTGHGLPAALGAVPVSAIHSAMAKKGLPLEILMDELNAKLNELLPVGIFSCIAGIDLDATRTHAHIWNAGLPEVLVVDQLGEITQRIVSNHLPLGVVSYEKDELHCQDIRIEKGDSIYMLSDGLTEAENEAGEMFGQQRFEQLLMNEADEHGRLIDIRNSVGQFSGKAAATDDISLIEIKTLSTVDEIILQ